MGDHIGSWNVFTAGADPAFHEMDRWSRNGHANDYLMGAVSNILKSFGPNGHTPDRFKVTNNLFDRLDDPVFGE